MVGQVQLFVQLDAVIRRVDEVWVAVCPPLDVASQADSSEAALESLTEAVEGWFESCLDRKVLDQALLECGFRRSSSGAAGNPDAAGIDSTRTPADHRTIRCSVPAYVLAALNEMHAPCWLG
jgi:predicted RNase H-like HicB family nuclease